MCKAGLQIDRAHRNGNGKEQDIINVNVKIFRVIVVFVQREDITAERDARRSKLGNITSRLYSIRNRIACFRFRSVIQCRSDRDRVCPGREIRQIIPKIMEAVFYRKITMIFSIHKQDIIIRTAADIIHVKLWIIQLDLRCGEFRHRIR